MPVKPSRRRRRDHPRRQELIRAAAKLFAERGFHGTSMDDIAEALNIQKGSLYYWITSKEELLREVLFSSLQESVEQTREIVSRRDLLPSERLRALIHAHIQNWVNNPDHFVAFLTEYRWLDQESLKNYTRMTGEHEGFYKDLLREGIRTGEFQIPERDLSIVIQSIFGILAWFPRWYRPHGWASPAQIADVTADLILNGLRQGLPHAIHDGAQWTGVQDW